MGNNHMTACAECDLLIDLSKPPLQKEVACCPRCQHRLIVGHENRIDTVIALSICAIILLVIASSFPFISFDAQGQSRTINLLQAPQELYSQHAAFLSLVVTASVVILPLTYLLLVLALVIPIKLGLNPVAPIQVAKMVSMLLPWAMAEVFIIGVLVALIKVIALADIVLGLSFWAYALFSLAFIYIDNLVDAHTLWHWADSGEAPILEGGQ